MVARCSDRLLQRFRKEVELWALLLLSKEHMESFLLLSWPLRHYEPYNEFRKKALESYWLSSIFRHAIQFPILRILVLTRFPLHNHCYQKNGFVSGREVSFFPDVAVILGRKRTSKPLFV